MDRQTTRDYSLKIFDGRKGDWVWDEEESLQPGEATRKGKIGLRERTWGEERRPQVSTIGPKGIQSISQMDEKKHREDTGL